jgi:hypothetical protein
LYAGALRGLIIILQISCVSHGKQLLGLLIKVFLALQRFCDFAQLMMIIYNGGVGNDFKNSHYKL